MTSKNYSQNTLQAISRRRFCQGGLGTVATLAGVGGLSQVLSAQSHAATGPEQFYIFCYFRGGWDILLSLDPRDPAIFHAGNMSTTRIQPAYDMLAGTGRTLTRTASMDLGPFMGELTPLHEQLAIVRGLSMETLTHQAGMRRFLTGRPPSGLLPRGSSTATWLAAHLGRLDPLPNIAVDVESYNVDQPTFASAIKVQNVPDLVRTLGASADGLNVGVEHQIAAFLAQQSECISSQRSPLKVVAEAARHSAGTMVSSGYDSRFDFLASTAEMEQLRSHYGIGNTVAALSSAEAQGALAARAITGGLSRCVSITVADDLDTHFVDWADVQGPRQEVGFNVIARIATDLASQQFRDTSESWLDRTTIVAFSEFSRTPLLNAREGRDHALTNACLLMGGKIKGGQTIGASSNYGMSPQPLNLDTGVVEAGGVIPRPEHIWQTLLNDVGLSADEADLRVPPIPALLRT